MHDTFTLVFRVQKARTCREKPPLRGMTGKSPLVGRSARPPCSRLAVIKMSECEQKFRKTTFTGQVASIYGRARESTSSAGAHGKRWRPETALRESNGRCFRQTMRNKISRFCRRISEKVNGKEKFLFLFSLFTINGKNLNDWRPF